MALTKMKAGPPKPVRPGAAWIAILLWAAIPATGFASGLTILATFSGTNGANPKAPLISANGNFYGTTSAGGANGFGSIFSITPGGTLTTLYSFAGATDGTTPLAPLFQGIDGNFYGTASAGGTGSGTIFSITPAGTFTVLYTFTGALDGGVPLGGLAQDGSGTFYGTTSIGGAHSNAGTVFSLTSSPQGGGTGTFATLYNFCGMEDCADGGTPEAGLIQGKDGIFYGTTSHGGLLCLSSIDPDFNFGGCGTIFSITGRQSTPAGALTTIHSFCADSPNCADGLTPVAPLFQGADGNFYGTTSGVPSPHYVIDAGTIFSITPAGVFTTLYGFGLCSSCTSGNLPLGGVVQGTDGNFYGTTYHGGPGSAGTIWAFVPGQVAGDVYAFTGGSDSGYPDAGLVLGADGNLYGTTSLTSSVRRTAMAPYSDYLLGPR